MASLLISDLLLGKQEESIDFIKRACSIILTTSKESSKRDNRFISDKDGRICELLDLVSKLISEQEDFECDLDELKLVLDIVCYPYLATCQDSSRENPGGIKDEKSKVFHSASRLIATLLQKSKEFDPVATVIVSRIDSAISLYLEETHAINSDLGAGEGEGNINIPEQDVATGDKKFSIFAALEVLDCLLATSTTPFLSKLFTTTWYQELTTNAIDILEFGEPVVCARLCSIIMRKSNTTVEVVQRVWRKVQSIYQNSQSDAPTNNRSNIYLILSVLADRLLSPDVHSASSLHVDSTFWAIVRRGLLHHRDPLTRKRAVFLLKRALEVATVKGESFTVFISDEERAEETKYPLLSWNPENKERLLEVWNDFFLLYEALDEVQIHVVQPVLPKLMKLQEAAIPDDTGKRFLHTSWLTLLLERSFRHESKTITRWGMEQSLRLDVSKLPLLAQDGDKFIFGPLLSTLREDYLYMRSAEGISVAQRPDTACQLEELLTGIITRLSDEERKNFLRNLANGICNLMWGPVPLMLMTEVLSKLPRCPSWTTQQLYAFRELLQSSVSVFLPAFRSCIQTFLTLASINFLDTSKVSLHEFFTFLAALNAPGPLRRGDQIWEQLCCWLKSNEHTLLCDSSSIMDSTFLQDFRKVLSGNDHPSEGDGSLLHDVEVKRLVLQILALSDVRRELLPDHEREQSTLFTSLILPLQDILCSMGSHVYLPSGKADRAIQVLSSIVNFVLEVDMSVSNDPVLEELTSLLRSAAPEIFIYLKRRLFSLDSSKVTSLDKVHTYLDLLSAISNFVSNEAIAKSAGNQQVSQELSRFKESLTKDCQKVLTSSFDTQSPEALFRAYVAMEMVAWRLQHSHGEEVIFKDQDLFSKILKLELNTLHDNKKFPTDERDNTGRLIGIFLGRKWNCIQLFIEAGHVTVDVDVTLQSCIHELSLVSDVHSKLILDCAALLVRKLASSNPELCCEAITASWCCVLDSYRNKDFWELYSSFVKLAFQIELMQEGPESPIFESLNKIIEFILNKGKVKLGLVNFVITNICHTWHKMLSDESQARNVITAASNHLHLLKKAVLFGSLRKEGRLREEMLIYLSQNTSLGALRDRLKITSYEKDPALVRVTLINLIIRLGETKLPEAEKFLVDLLQSLLEEDISVTPQGKCYVINSQVHRIKQRVWQAALVIVNYLPKEPASSIFQQILLQLASENQSSAKHMMEWLVVLMTHRFPETVNQFWARVDEMVKVSRSGFSPILIIISHLGSVQPSRDCKISFYTKAIPIIFPWSMAPTSSLRVQSQVSLYKIWLDCKREGLSEVLEKFPALNASMEYNENRGSSITNKMEGNFFLRDFHPLLDYSIETIFQSLPYLTLVIEDELVLPELFSQDSGDLWKDGSTSIPLFNNRDALRTAQKLGKVAEKQRFATKGSSVDLNVIDFKEKPLPLGVDVQKKITPLREELAPGFGDSQSNPEGKRSQLVVVATLVDRLPNLGGLCRTSEIFGVEKLIIGSARYLEDKSFLGLSVTAERWLPMKEVRPSELKDYLTEMRHHGYTLVGVEQTANSVQMTEYRFPAKTVILLGNERTGIPVELIHHLDVCVEIPQLGYIRSLNVHVSGALMVWEYTKQQMLGL